MNKEQSLNKQLSIYKNQEYPEKLLEINNLRKKLSDINNLHNEEHENLSDIIKSETNRMKQTQNEMSRNITDKISTVFFSFFQLKFG